jgi:hypothetical protein
MLFSALARSCRATSSEMVGWHPVSRVNAALTVGAANGAVTRQELLARDLEPLNIARNCRASPGPAATSSTRSSPATSAAANTVGTKRRDRRPMYRSYAKCRRSARVLREVPNRSSRSSTLSAHRLAVCPGSRPELSADGRPSRRDGRHRGYRFRGALAIDRLIGGEAFQTSLSMMAPRGCRHKRRRARQSGPPGERDFGNPGGMLEHPVDAEQGCHRPQDRDVQLADEQPSREARRKWRSCCQRRSGGVR